MKTGRLEALATMNRDFSTGVQQAPRRARPWEAARRPVENRWKSRSPT